MKNPYLDMAKHFTEAELMQKHDKPMSETTPLNEFQVEMLGDLKTCLSACEHYKLPLKNIPKWLSIINAALKDARFEEETKGQRLPFE